MTPLVIDAGAIVTTALATVSAGIEGVAAPALAVAAGLVALTFGWRFVKKLVH